MAAQASTPIRRTASRFVGWLSDRGIPGFLRRPVFATYCLLTRADASEARLDYRGYTSLSAFFVRRLKEGARTIAADPAVLPSPCDGRVQAAGAAEAGRMLQAKGVDYPVEELLAGAAAPAEIQDAQTWTLYLSPRDYHRVHAPLEATLEEVRWVPGARYSVAPKVAARLQGLFALNERAVLKLSTPRGPYFLVMVGALNVGRIRVLGVAPDGPAPSPPRRFARGEELARFEMGSTVILVLPRALGFAPLPELTPGTPLRLGEPIGRT
ncbi:MAG: archaetidylserine decarboxylase [Planctomycetota bacterium]